MQSTLQNIANKLFSTLLAVILLFALAGCIKTASEDEEILNDAGTQEGAAIVVEPDNKG